MLDVKDCVTTHACESHCKWQAHASGLLSGCNKPDSCKQLCAVVAAVANLDVCISSRMHAWQGSSMPAMYISRLSRRRASALLGTASVHCIAWCSVSIELRRVQIPHSPLAREWMLAYLVSLVSTKPKSLNALLICIKCTGAACKTHDAARQV